MYRRFFIYVVTAASTAWCAGADAGRVIFLSLDGLGEQLSTDREAGRQLTTLQRLRRQGSAADGLIGAYPSTTANSHAALWTGAYVGVNGILYNRTPAKPRSEHTFTERINGFRSEGLTAEPIWITAARQGVPVVAHQVTQAFPFAANTVGSKPLAGFTMVNGYQSRAFAPWRVIRRKDVKGTDCGNEKCYEWTVADQIAITAKVCEGGLEISHAGRSVKVIAHSEETAAPVKRGLARWWSKPLEITGLPDDSRADLVFLLFELSAGDFLLLQGPLQETALYAESKADAEMARRLIAEAGPMAGNAAHALYANGALGVTLLKGGGGAAEARYLESVEWVVRQQIAHSAWLFHNRRPRLHMTYLPFPDEVEHTWLGLDRGGDTRFREYRRWGYAAIDRSIAALLTLSGKADHVVITSDHGMTPVFGSVDVNAILKQNGLGDKAVALHTCMLLNTSDWKGGTVQPETREQTSSTVEQVLRGIRTLDGKPAITRIYGAKELAGFGHGGPSGADLCMDFAPGWGPAESAEGEPVSKLAVPRGTHGFDPTRRDMQALLVVRGPRMKSGASLGRLKSTAVAPLITKLLGVEAPANATGQAPVY